MGKLRDKINLALDIFDVCGISEEEQLYIIGNDGVYFNFSYGEDRQKINRKFDTFKFARFLKFCYENGIKLDIDKLIFGSYYEKGIMELVHSFDKLDKVSKEYMGKEKNCEGFFESDKLKKTR